MLYIINASVFHSGGRRQSRAKYRCNMQQKSTKTIVKRVSIIVLSVLGAIALLLGAFALVIRIGVGDYYDRSFACFTIPGINEGFVPQGIEYDKDNDLLLIGGYMNDGTASPVYLVGVSSGEVKKKIYLNNLDGTAFTGHAGGLTFYGDKLYVASGKVYVYSYKDILEASDGAKISCHGTLKGVGEDEGVYASFAAVYGKNLVIGEYYKQGFGDQPPASHAYTAANGVKTGALALSYKFTSTEELGVSLLPNAAFTLPEKTQGMYFEDDAVYLSASFGIEFSTVGRYSLKKATAADKLNFGGTELTVYELNSDSLEKSVTLAPMAEELVKVGKDLIVLNESASGKYLFGRLSGMDKLYATDFDKMK